MTLLTQRHGETKLVAKSVDSLWSVTLQLFVIHLTTHILAVKPAEIVDICGEYS